MARVDGRGSWRRRRTATTAVHARPRGGVRARPGDHPSRSPAALRTSLDQLRVSWEVGALSNVRRGNCLSATPLVRLGELSVERWRRRPSWCSAASRGLDGGGGAPREFFFKVISELLRPAKGVFRMVEGSTYWPPARRGETSAKRGGGPRPHVRWKVVGKSIA